ncbi:glycosyltransferase family 2 protein [Vibrio cyclitrophicus]
MYLESNADLSICILTLNEEKNIRRCLEGLKSCTNDIHVIDSGSTDATLEILEEYQVKVYSNIQSGVYSAAVQRNWALDNIESESKWVLFIDADEIINEDSYTRISKDIEEQSSFDVISVPLVYYFHEKKIKSMGYPNWHDRVVKRTARFSSSVGEFVTSERRHYILDAPIQHNFNSLGMRRFMEKQTRYAEFIGKSTYSYLCGENVDYFNKSDGNAKLKKKVAKLGLLRPFLRFIYLYIYKRGFLEGKEGFIVAIYMAIFEFLVVVALKEERREKESKVL